jgi:hypothetical protein
MDDSTKQVEHFAGVQARTSVDHALRAVQQNFTQLSTAADHKASIVIGSTLVVLSVLVGTVHSGEAPVAAYVMGGFTAPRHRSGSRPAQHGPTGRPLFLRRLRHDQ